MYNLTLQEQIELDKFLKENMEKGYSIQPSQSPMASPFFFVDKKDGEKCWTGENTQIKCYSQKSMKNLNQNTQI